MSKSETNKDPLKPSKESVTPLEEKIEGELLQDPKMLERLLKNPEVKAVLRKEYYSGPLPPPKALADYNNIVDGAAERILIMAELEQKHRHQIESTALLGEINNDKRGQRFGFGIAITFGVMALVLGLSGQQWLGGIIATVDLLALVTVFVLGRRSVE